jgi:hypothetical protein
LETRASEIEKLLGVYDAEEGVIMIDPTTLRLSLSARLVPAILAALAAQSQLDK